MRVTSATQPWQRIDVRVAAAAGLVAAVLLVGGVLWFRAEVHRQQVDVTQQTAMTEALDLLIAAPRWADAIKPPAYVPYQLFRSDGTFVDGADESTVRRQGWTGPMPDPAAAPSQETLTGVATVIVMPSATGVSKMPDMVTGTLTGKRDQILVRGDTTGYHVYVYVTPAAADATVAGMSRYLWWGAALAWLLVTATAAVTVRLALRPVERMRREAARITSTANGTRLLPTRRHDELGALAATLDTMLARLDDSFQAQQRFTADAAHELRGPLTSLRAAVEVALAHPEDVTADETLRHVLAEIERLQDLSEQLLAVSRARSATAAPGAATDPDAAVDRVLAGYPAPDAERVRVVDNRTTARPASIAPADLHRVLRNLLDNALGHAATGVRVDLDDEGPDLVVLTVTNDGAPIPDEQRERIFEPFVRLDEARSRDDGGTGLGLTIVRGLVERAGGSVTAGSRDGHTSFVVRLPANRPVAALLPVP